MVYRRHNKAELRIEGYRGLANDSPVVGDANFGIESVLYTPPIHYDWRRLRRRGLCHRAFRRRACRLPLGPRRRAAARARPDPRSRTVHARVWLWRAPGRPGGAGL
ncbi:hypothetical protein [Cupriavidus consociatus]|uniref:hypothetical protein n=1 Tax=Cupriavidus consociatus TaxID=2821357 RepID=UPI003D7376B7